MIDLYTWTTPNGRKPSIMLEECGLDYKVHPINIGKDEQFAPDFLKISPNNKIPAIVDHDGVGGPTSIFESGAILIYLAEKTGKFLPKQEPARSQVMSWLMFQMGGIGPMMGQFSHFARFSNEKIPYAINRYETETHRLFGVMEKTLNGSDYLAGNYSIADIATYPWVSVGFNMLEMDSEKYPNIEGWLDRIDERPAVQRGMAVPKV